MKKVLAFILCFVYVVASSGATINLHYCMGRFIGWDVNTPVPVTCNNCGMHKEQKKDCCNDKHATFQIEKNQLGAAVNNVPANHFIYISRHYSAVTNTIFCIDDEADKSTHSPPLSTSISANILNCVFRI